MGRSALLMVERVRTWKASRSLEGNGVVSRRPLRSAIEPGKDTMAVTISCMIGKKNRMKIRSFPNKKLK